MTARRGRTPARPWGSWMRCPGFKTPDGAEHLYPEHETVVRNDLYTVTMQVVPPDAAARAVFGDRAVLWLSIKRNDRKPIHDWRHLQRIKNELAGSDFEAIEVYPAESRLVDTANQFHLWVIADPDFRIPLGWEAREVSGPEAAALIGARQRPFEVPTEYTRTCIGCGTLTDGPLLCASCDEARP